MTSQDLVALYCALGWLPVPLLPRSKRPAYRYKHLNDVAGPFGPAHYGAPWAQRPDLGCAILLKPSGLLVIDCDSLAALEEAVATSPPTWSVLTRQGAHMYYRNPTGRAVRAIHRGQSGKIDLLCNGYVVAPPSIHETGHVYAWANLGACEHLPEAPEWACRAIETARDTEAPVVPFEAAAGLLSARVVPVDWIRVRAVNPKVHKLLTSGSEPGSDRSRDLWVTINTLVRLNYTDEQVMQTIWQSAVGEKPRQKGVQWLAGEVARARLELQPEPRP